MTSHVLATAWLRTTAFGELVRSALKPWEAFATLAFGQPTLGESLRRLLLWRTPITVVGGLLSLAQYRALRANLLGGVAPFSMADLTPEPGLLRELGAVLPAAPEGAAALAWVLLLAPLSVLSLWLHHAVWDHGALWILGCRGLRFRATAIADAEAVWVGTAGAALALLGEIPGVGWLLLPILLPLGLWFWGLRGFALAAWHGLPVWKGVVATVVHAVGAVVLFFLTLILAWLLAMQMAGV